MNNNLNELAIRWLWIGIIILIIMVSVGGITRLTQSGLSMVEWHPLTGILPPLNYNQWIDAFEQYKQYPEYKIINNDMTLTEFKTIYFWEYIHRLLGRLIGIVFIIPFIYFILKGLDKKIVKKLIILLILGGLQGYVGWYMVKSGLVDLPHVSHLRLAVHLILAFIIIAYSFWIILLISNTSLKKVSTNQLLNLSYFILFLIGVQTTFGAFTAGLKAGYSWNTFPLMDGVLFSKNLFYMKPWWNNIINDKMTIQFMHRFFGTILLLSTFYLKFKSYQINVTSQHRYSINLLVICTTIQYILGIMTLLLYIPIGLGVLHQIGAIITTLLCLLTIFNLKYS